MRVLSLFDGISTGRIALERAGIPVEVYYSSEVDKNAIAVSNYHYPDIIRLGDINNIDFKQYKDVDLILSGSPCQNLSVANRNREGIYGKNSNLFFKFIESLEVIKPKYFIQENVASMKNEDKEIMTKLLTALYPETSCITINSALVSAQNRKRLYWTNFSVHPPCDKGIYLQDILEDIKVDVLTGDFNTDGCIKYDGKYKCLNGKEIFISNLNIPYCFKEVRTELGKRLRSGARAKGKGDITLRGANHKCFVPNDCRKANCLTTSRSPESIVCIGNTIRYLTVTEWERLQTLPDNYTLYGKDKDIFTVSDNARFHMLGNGWTTDVIVHILGCLDNPPLKRKRIFK